MIPAFEGIPLINGILGLLVLAVPGFFWALVILQGGKIKPLERIVFAFGIAIALLVVVLAVLGKVVNLPVNTFSILVTISAITLIPLVILCVRYLKKRA